ncbi:transposase [Citrobacter freundii]|nr:transposase [Citrobacter freundii]
MRHLTYQYHQLRRPSLHSSHDFSNALAAIQGIFYPVNVINLSSQYRWAEADNNIAENALRMVSLGRKNSYDLCQEFRPYLPCTA